MEMEAAFDVWALVELMGHQRIAGRVTEAQIGGAKFVRVDVPASEGVQALTKYLGSSSIYAITPVTEETATAIARQLKVAPISEWDARKLIDKPQPRMIETHNDEDEDDGIEDDERPF
jgi:hypothetical protein